MAHDFRFDCTLLEKAKAEPQVRESEVALYKYAWYLHFKFLADKVIRPGDEVVIVAAELGTAKRRSHFRSVIDGVVRQCAGITPDRVLFWPCKSDPCLQVADYCLWAVGRKHERNDERSYKLIEPRIASEFRPFDSGNTYYY